MASGEWRVANGLRKRLVLHHDASPHPWVYLLAATVPLLPLCARARVCVCVCVCMYARACTHVCAIGRPMERPPLSFATYTAATYTHCASSYLVQPCHCASYIDDAEEGQEVQEEMAAFNSEDMKPRRCKRMYACTHTPTPVWYIKTHPG